MRSFSLSPQAFESLENIHLYSIATFGAIRGEAYVANLLERCHGLAAGTLPHQSCRAIFAADVRSDLRLVRAGRHTIIFTESLSEVRIVQIIHQSADIARRLRDTP